MQVNSKPEPRSSSLEDKVDSLTETLNAYLEHLAGAVEAVPEAPETPYYVRLRFADGSFEDVANITDVEVYRKDSESPVFIVGDDEEQEDAQLIVVAPDGEEEPRIVARESHGNPFNSWGGGA